MIKCDTCPWCKDAYPGKLDTDGYHFYICGMSGNKVYKEPHKIKRYSGKGYISLGISSCGIYDTVEDVLAKMTESERRRWEEANNEGLDQQTGSPENHRSQSGDTEQVEGDEDAEGDTEGAVSCF